MSHVSAAPPTGTLDDRPEALCLANPAAGRACVRQGRLIYMRREAVKGNFGGFFCQRCGHATLDEDAPARGGKWTAVQVGSILQRVEAHSLQQPSTEAHRCLE
jgi:hypothetical protein